MERGQKEEASLLRLYAGAPQSWQESAAYRSSNAGRRPTLVGPGAAPMPLGQSEGLSPQRADMPGRGHGLSSSGTHRVLPLVTCATFHRTLGQVSVHVMHKTSGRRQCFAAGPMIINCFTDTARRILPQDKIRRSVQRAGLVVVRMMR